jgi:hypothetical protein
MALQPEVVILLSLILLMELTPSLSTDVVQVSLLVLSSGKWDGTPWQVSSLTALAISSNLPSSICLGSAGGIHQAPYHQVNTGFDTISLRTRQSVQFLVASDKILETRLIAEVMGELDGGVHDSIAESTPYRDHCAVLYP